MIVSILHNIAQIPELVDELRRNQCLEVRVKKLKLQNFKFFF
jgi:hypothetical protein